MWSKLAPNRLKSGSKWDFLAFSSYFIKRGKILWNLYFRSVDYIIFTYNSTASFFRHWIVECPWIEFKRRPMLFKKSWNLFYSNVVGLPVKLNCFSEKSLCWTSFRAPGKSIFTIFISAWGPLFITRKTNILNSLKHPSIAAHFYQVNFNVVYLFSSIVQSHIWQNHIYQ